MPSDALSVAVIGGGINGICTALRLAQLGAKVTLYERDRLMRATSQKTSKLLHGGLRYLEKFEFRLVREALKERNWWLQHCPQYTRKVQLMIPVYENSGRAPWMFKLGLVFYELLAGRDNIDKHQRISRGAFLAANPQLKTDHLLCGFGFYDGMMDDYQLGLWMADQARKADVTIIEQAEVVGVNEEGLVKTQFNEKRYDYIANVAGPWAEQLLNRSGLNSRNHLDYVRGSHIILEEQHPHAYLLQVPSEERIFFVLPHQNHTLVGTTEVRQSLAEPITSSSEEIEYLLAAYNHYFQKTCSSSAVIRTYCGLRPLLKTAGPSHRASREYAIEQQNQLITVMGGKWTTARALAEKVARRIIPTE